MGLSGLPPDLAGLTVETEVGAFIGRVASVGEKENALIRGRVTQTVVIGGAVLVDGAVALIVFTVPIRSFGRYFGGYAIATWIVGGDDFSCC